MARGSRAVDIVLGALGELLITLGVLLLLFVSWQVWWTDVAANRGQSAAAAELTQHWESAEPNQPGFTPSNSSAFAILHIPRFGPDWAPRPIVAGTTAEVLEGGVGHYTDVAGPGQVGNFALAGHRVTYGRPFFQIDQLAEGDAIVVETADGWYTYRMTSSQIVSPRDVEVIAPVPNEPGAVPTQAQITLTACHPKFSARQRFIVHGLLEGFQPRAAGPPASLEGSP